MQRVLNFKDNKLPLLYLVASPIGNMDEISKRTLEVLNEADIIACEDTRVTGKLLALLQIKKPLLACHEHNEQEISEQIVTLLLEGKSEFCYHTLRYTI